MVDQTIDLLLQYPNCLSSSHYEPGHITGSAWITDPEGRMTLLVHHAKLDRWLQPGGHLEPGEDAWSGAYREGCEETGIKKFISHDKEIFDVDVHPIPVRGDVPAHLHFDVRFRFIADPAETLVLTEESKGIQWIPLTDVRMWNKEPSIIRLVRKTLALLNKT